jgi:sugar O-acyltransferase (sialic acid O-acetyltransferase NeuD family)
MKNLLIVGAGGFGREIFSWATDMINAQKATWAITGFLDDDANALEGYNYPISILSSLDNYTVGPNDTFVCAVGDPATKEKIIAKLKAKGAKNFATIVHPTAVLGYNVQLGEGVILCPMVVINADAKLGDFVTVNNQSNVGHNSTVGQYTQISGYCDITGGVTIGEKAFFGSSVAVLPGTKIGNNVIVGAGSVVVRRVEDDSTVFGNPAKKITF